MSLRIILLCISVISLGFADTVTLRDGKQINGSYLGGDARNVRIAVGDRVETYRVDEISTITFGAAAASTAAASTTPSTSSLAQEEPPRVMRPQPRYEQAPTSANSTAAKSVDLPAGTAITIRMIDDVDSERDVLGQTFRATVDEPLLSGGETVVPRGADVIVKLVDDKQSGRLEGKTVLTLDIVSMKVNGRTVEIDTQAVSQESASRTAKSGKVIGGGAALGAIIGAIAGGGKGAAIGAVSGAGAGTAVQVLTKGQRVKIPSETRLTFTLQQPVRI
jgi:hypothetical protein